MKVNKHSPKIFQAIEEFKMEEGSDRPSVLGLKSGVGVENVTLKQPLKLVGKVENYLQDMIDAIVSTLHTITTQSFINHAKTPRPDWIKQDPAQVTILVNNIVTSSNIEDCFKKISDGSNVNALKDSFKKSVEELTGLIKMVQGELTKEERQKIMCLITLDTHSRDIIDKLDVENVKKADAFQWQSQLKFYWTDNKTLQKKDCQIRIADASFWYSYEYLGNGPRLVVTPLTDRIYVTATQALHLKMGCAPAGPAGTGKTETTKDLSSALAKAIYVFNCSG
jgi:dynein heavy chain, axonemal